MRISFLKITCFSLLPVLLSWQLSLSQEGTAPPAAPAHPEVQGEVGGVWTEAESPYIVVGDVTVPAESTLVIEPGTTIRFAGYYQLKIEGRIEAAGDGDHRITFTSGSDSPRPGDWAGIYLSGSSSGGIISGCSVNFAHIGISLKGSGPLTISGNEISNSRASGITCESVTDSILIEGNNIHNCVDGIVCREDASPRIAGNTIVDNSGVGILCENSSKPVIEGNFLSRNRSSGITCNFGSDASVVRNVMAKNGNGMSYTSSAPSVVRCDILENEFSGIVCFKTASPSISESNIWGNGLFEIKNSGTGSVTARGNWWGEDTGPGGAPLRIFDSEDDPSKGPVDASEPLVGPSLNTPGQPSPVSSIALFSDSDGSSPIVDKVSEGGQIWIFLKGTDGNSYAVDKTSITVRRSVTDPSGMKVILTESGPSTGTFRALLVPYREPREGKQFLKVVNGEMISFSCDLDPSKEISVMFVSLPPVVENLLIQNGKGPIRVQVTAPSFSWGYSDPEGDPATQFQIELGTDPEWTGTPIWQLSLPGDVLEATCGLELERGKDYYVRVRAHDGFGWGEWTVSSFRVNAIPSKPLPVFPPDGTTVRESLRPRLTVRNSSDADGDKLSYQFQAFYDSAMTKLALESEKLIPESEGETYWRRMPQLLENTRYWWRARAYDGYTYSDWSELSSFSVNTYDERTYPFSLVSPGDGEVVRTLRPKFDWEDTMDPDPGEEITYTLIYGTDPSLKGAAEIKGLSGRTSELVPGEDLSDNTVYYWKVAAVLDGQVQQYSNETWSFFVNLFNDPPSISKIAPVSIDEDSQYSLDLNGYVSDPDHRPEELKWEVSADPYIAAEITDGNVLRLVPSENWNGGPETFTVKVTDPLGASDSTSFTVTVLPVNDPPVARAIPDIVVEEDTVYELNLNDYVEDIDNPKDELAWTADAGPNLRVEIEGGMARIEGVLNWNGGPERVAFRVSDPEGGTDDTGVNVTVLPVNDPPELSEIPAIVFKEDSPISLGLDDYVTDPDNSKDELVWMASQDPNLKVRIDPTSHVAFFSTPPNWYGGPIGISFTVSDPDGLKDETTVEVTVAPVNDPPELSKIPDAKFDEDTKYSFDLDDYVSDVDNANDELRWSVSGNRNISVQIDPTTHVATLSAPHNWYGGPETITFHAIDPEGAEGSTSAQFEVLSVVEPPAFSRIPALSFKEDESTSIDLDDYLSDPDHDNSELEISVVNPPHISARLDGATRVLTFNAPRDWYGGPEVVVLKAVDPDSASAEAEISVKVTPVNDPPVLEDIPPIAFDEDSSISLDLSGYVSDVDDTKFSWRYSGAENLKVKLDSSSGALELSAPKDWYGGPEIITFTVSDASGASDSRDVEVTVRPVNDPPVALKIPDVKFDEDMSYTLSLDSYVRDVDNTADEMSWTATGGKNVSVRITPERSAVMSAPRDWYGGPEEITFRVTDPSGASAETRTRVTVSPVNDPPVLKDIPPVAFDEDGSATLRLRDYASDVDDDTFFWKVEPGANIAVELDGVSEAVTFRAPPDWYGGPERVKVTVRDPSGASATGVVEVTVRPVNDPPVLSKIPGVTFDEDSGTALDLSAYVSDVDNDISELSWNVSGGREVNVTISGSRASFSASENWNGEEELMLTVRDPSGAEATSPIKVTVRPVNDPVSITSSSPEGEISVPEGGRVTMEVKADDPDGDVISYSWTVNGRGVGAKGPSYTYEAAPGSAGSEVEVTVKVSDGSTSDSKSWLIRIVAPPEQPQGEQ